MYQPRGYTYPKVAWTDIRQNGKWVRPRNFLDSPDPAKAYYEAMLEMYRSRMPEAKWWLSCISGRDIALCCWCPHDRAAKRQLEEFGTFICHTGPLGTFLEELGVDVEYDHLRDRMYRLEREE